MPKKNPKHQARIERQQGLTKRGKRIYNWKKIGGILILCVVVGAFITLGIIYGPKLGRREIQEGDTVYIYYELYDTNDTLLENSTDDSGTKFTIKQFETEPKGFHREVLYMVEGEEKNFVIDACPNQDCKSYLGYTIGEHAWKELRYYVRIVSFA